MQQQLELFTKDKVKISQPIYLVGSLRNPLIPTIAYDLRKEGFDIFDSWYAAGPIADDSWMQYERSRGLSYKEALKDWAATHVFDFDRFHLNRCRAGILAMPAGKSGHLELGYLMGQNKPGWILYPGDPSTNDAEFRWDVMSQFANQGIFFSMEELIADMKEFYGRT